MSIIEKERPLSDYSLLQFAKRGYYYTYISVFAFLESDESTKEEKIELEESLHQIETVYEYLEELNKLFKKDKTLQFEDQDTKDIIEYGLEGFGMLIESERNLLKSGEI